MGISFRELVARTIGEASVVLWDETPKGTFDSTKATELTNQIILAHIKVIADLTSLSPDEFKELVKSFGI